MFVGLTILRVSFAVEPLLIIYSQSIRYRLLHEPDALCRDAHRVKVKGRTRSFSNVSATHPGNPQDWGDTRDSQGTDQWLRAPKPRSRGHGFKAAPRGGRNRGHGSGIREFPDVMFETQINSSRDHRRFR
jgi:hypothetical protein